MFILTNLFFFTDLDTFSFYLHFTQHPIFMESCMFLSVDDKTLINAVVQRLLLWLNKCLFIHNFCVITHCE